MSSPAPLMEVRWAALSLISRFLSEYLAAPEGGELDFAKVGDASLQTVLLSCWAALGLIFELPVWMSGCRWWWRSPLGVMFPNVHIASLNSHSALSHFELESALSYSYVVFVLVRNENTLSSSQMVLSHPLRKEGHLRCKIRTAPLLTHLSVLHSVHQGIA